MTTDTTTTAATDNTDTAATVTEPNTAATDTENTTATPPEQPDDDTTSTAGQEAAKYRRKLRHVEAERDTLASRLQAAHRREVERLASSTVTRPEALWAAGVEVDDLLDAEGNVDEEKVTDAVTDVADRLGLAEPNRTPLPDSSQGGAWSPAAPEPQFSDAFGPSTARP